MSHKDPQGGYKVILVPAENIRTYSPPGILPAYVTVSQDVMYEVIGDAGPDRQLAVSRQMYEQFVVID